MESRRHRGSTFKWFNNAGLKKVPVSCDFLCKKAEQFMQIMSVKKLRPTDGWLSQWKEWNNIVYCQLYSEKQDADLDTADYWKVNILPDLLEDYDPSQICNTDETGLIYRALPELTHMCKTEFSEECEKIKQHITILLTCHMMGTINKTPLVIGGNKKLHYFKGLKSLPIYCNSNKK